MSSTAWYWLPLVMFLVIIVIIYTPKLIEGFGYVFGRGVARGKIEATRKAFGIDETTDEKDEDYHAEK